MLKEWRDRREQWLTNRSAREQNSEEEGRKTNVLTYEETREMRGKYEQK